MVADIQFNNSPYQKMKFILVSDFKIIYQTLENNISTFLGSDTCDNEQYEMWYEMLQIQSVQLKSGPYFNP